ncbi:polyribonucleotide nucleotidyltransferase [Treponema parvum]|uniref:Polyribonucleotide nucleotidyltransferase n=1 Tax=Treponema parvum TaxID=138851 RepID=A0A975F058_9SPIR|nr:polyribonucleotide nucleotidyltransferase [Treponema parvum]QTQ12131.1 polyribonucleotide nucleotidyltransferase [Treponema parvum]QTQ15878.1 polyribonucleotide nucleotidyltransferase [Treponema parvum]
MVQRVTYKIGDEELILETGKIGKQANGCVYAQFSGTAVIATVCASGTVTEGMDYVPVTVDYNEKFYAAGKIPGGFVKREGRPKDKEILVSRLIDRPMRPLFEMAFGREIQIVPTCVSTDGVHTPDILAVIASSAAVTISDIPFHGPVAACRVAYIDGEYVVNPTFQQIEKAKLEIVVAGTAEGFTMVEGGAHEASEDVMLGALEKAQEFITQMCRLQEELQKKAGKEKLPLAPLDVTLQNAAEIENEATPLVKEASFKSGKMARSAAVKAVKKQISEKYAAQLEDPVQKKLFDALFDDIQYKLLRKSILDEGVRIDGRKCDEIRPITCEIGVLPRPHGSALFTRGETQSLAVTTLGTALDEQIYDDIDGDRSENFILHYNFPPYSVGEVGRLATGRREIGHGNLARRSLAPMVPSREEFPYTIRVVSEIMESNGSSSQASTCGGCLSMLAAGVPMKKMVAGIAMGLITDGPKYEKYKILSDILGEEDHLGDMDFKVAGTKDGITGFQMDIKIAGVTTEIMKKAMEQAKEGRLHILSIMEKCIDKPAPISQFAPKILSMKIPIDKIGVLIGPAGKNIKALCADYDVTINTEDDGTVTIYGKTGDAAERAKKAVKGITEDPEVGAIYNGTVKRLMDFGAFVEILPGKEGLCHISKLSRSRVNKVSDVLKEGQQIPVKLLEVDKMGRLNLSYIDAVEAQEKK